MRPAGRSIPTSSPFRQLGVHPPWFNGASIASLAIDPASELIAVASSESLRVYRLTTGERVREIAQSEVSQDPPYLPDSRTTFDPSGRHLYWFARGALWQWDVGTGATVNVWSGADVGPIVAASRDRRVVLMATAASAAHQVAVWDLASAAVLQRIDAGRPITAAAISDDGGLAILAGPIAELWDLEHARILRTLGGSTVRTSPDPTADPHEVEAVALSPDGSLALIARAAFARSAHASLELFDTDTGALRVRIDGPDPPDQDGESAPLGLAFTADGRFAIGGLFDLRVVEVATGKRRLITPQAPATMYGVEALAVSPDSRWLVTGHEDGSLCVIDLATGHMFPRPTPPDHHAGDIHAVACSGDGSRVISASRDDTLRLWDAETGTLLRRWPITFRPKVIALGPDAGWATDEYLRRWSDSIDASAPSGGVTILAAAFDRGSRQLLRAAVAHGADPAREGAKLALWTVDPPALRQLFAHPEHADVIALGPGARHVAAAHSQRAPIRIWDVATGALVAELPVRVGGFLAFSCDERLLYVEEFVSEIVRRHQVHDVATGALVASLDVPAGRPLSAIAGSPTAPIVATAVDRHSLITLWNLHTGAELHHFAGHDGSPLGAIPVESLAFSADGQTLVSGGGDRIVRLWRIPSS